MITALLLILGCFSGTVSQRQYCEVFGSVHEVKDPWEADYIVYATSSEVSADIIVFEQQNKFYADKPGMWFFEENREFSTFKVYFTDREREAQFTVYFTRFESFAGCND